MPATKPPQQERDEEIAAAARGLFGSDALGHASACLTAAASSTPGPFTSVTT